MPTRTSGGQAPLAIGGPNPRKKKIKIKIGKIRIKISSPNLKIRFEKSGDQMGNAKGKRQKAPGREDGNLNLMAEKKRGGNGRPLVKRENSTKK